MLLNLWKNSAEAGATVVRVTIFKEASSITLRITDNGHGISADRLERVWIPYVTYKKGGSGLGLPVVKRLVEAMQGSAVIASSCDGKENGVTVTITLRDIP